MSEVIIGIDIGGTNTVFGIVDLSGNCIAKDSLQTDSYETVDLFVNILAKKISGILEKNNRLSELAGIGIGAPNGNFFKGTIENAPNLRWKGIINFTDMIEKYFDVPVLLTNDANAAALGEKIYGGAKKMKNFILITLGTGVGSGFVVNGELLYGHDGFAGEVGHTISITGGRLCGCGRNGCLETYCSANGIVQTVIERLEAGEKSILSKIPVNNLKAKDIHQAAIEGDKLALDAFDYTGKLLGEKLADVVAITSPEAIFLFGGLANAGDFIFKPVKKYMEQTLLPIFRNKVKLLPSQLPEDNAAILGAAALISQKFQTNKLKI